MTKSILEMSPPASNVPFAGPLKTDVSPEVIDRAAKTPFRAKITGPDGKVLFDTNVKRDAAERIQATLAALPVRSQRKVIEDVKRQLAEQDEAKRASYMDEVKASLDQLEKDLPVVERMMGAPTTEPEIDAVLKISAEGAKAALDVMEEFEQWAVDGIRLERPIGTRAHLLRVAIDAGRIAMWTDKGPNSAAFVKLDTWAESERPVIGQVFVVEHDWASAFAGAQDYAESDLFKLPYPQCCFELRISGKNVCVLVRQAEGGDAELGVFIELKTSFENAWLHAPASTIWSSVVDFAMQQLKAICVSLEAEAATHEVVRASYKLNQARERRGKLPLYDHHVVKLAGRTRAAPRAPDAERTPGTKRRLHFRRAHWRHYENHQTWIKWMLVGDPDLGFVDKEYRL